MIRRLLMILLAVTQIAALPLAIEPEEVEIGRPVTVSIALPDDSYRLLGVPDLGPFVLIAPIEQDGNRVTLRLLPLRPGMHSIPPLPFSSGQRRMTSAATPARISAPELPKTPHPLRALPEADTEPAVTRQGAALIVGGGLLLLFLAIAVRRRPGRHSAEPSLDDRLFALAVAAKRASDNGDPDWRQFCQRLDRIRFAPIPLRHEELEELTEDFVRLSEEKA